MITDAILPSLLRQDPRYFYKGTGSIRSRALYAVATVFIWGGQGRHRSLAANYSNVFGNLATAGHLKPLLPIRQSQPSRVTIDNWLIGNASGAPAPCSRNFSSKKSPAASTTH